MKQIVGVLLIQNMKEVGIGVGIQRGLTLPITPTLSSCWVSSDLQLPLPSLFFYRIDWCDLIMYKIVIWLCFLHLDSTDILKDVNFFLSTASGSGSSNSLVETVLSSLHREYSLFDSWSFILLDL